MVYDHLKYREDSLAHFDPTLIYSDKFKNLAADEMHKKFCQLNHDSVCQYGKGNNQDTKLWQGRAFDFFMTMLKYKVDQFDIPSFMADLCKGGRK